MGKVRRILGQGALPERDDHNSRMFVDLAENVHFHYREFRNVFSVDEFMAFSAAIGDARDRLREEVRAGYKEGTDAKGKIIGGSQREKLPLPTPKKSDYFDTRFVIEEQANKDIDTFHIHYRDFRIAINNEEAFLRFCKVVREAETQWRKTKRVRVDEIVSPYPKTAVRRLGVEHTGTEPVLLSSDGLLINGHKRVSRAAEDGKEFIDAIRVGITFKESEPIRMLDSEIKKSKRWDLLARYRKVLALLA